MRVFRSKRAHVAIFVASILFAVSTMLLPAATQAQPVSLITPPLAPPQPPPLHWGREDFMAVKPLAPPSIGWGVVSDVPRDLLPRTLAGNEIAPQPRQFFADYGAVADRHGRRKGGRSLEPAHIR